MHFNIALYMCKNITILGFAIIMDLIVGDPRKLPHLVIYMGKCISFFEKFFRKHFDKKHLKAAGFIIVILDILITIAFVSAVKALYLTKIPVIAICILETVLISHMLAAKSLRQESMKVYYGLKEGDIEKSRYAISMIVGRDTKSLDEEAIIKADVETIAENFSDGVVAPCFYALLFGIYGTYVYKMINTMDSMIGYKDEKYKDIGMAAAKLDDVVNFIPARLSAYLLIIASFFMGLDYKNAFKIYKRDRYKHSSPNAAHTEAVVAGALGVKLAGDAYYFGKLVKKESIGDELRKPEVEDIVTVNKLMYRAVFIILSLITIILIVMVMSGVIRWI